MLRKFLITLLICTGTVAAIQAQTTDEFNLDETYSIDFDGTVNLQSDDAEVRITGSNRDDVRVIVHYQLTVRGITFGDSNEFELVVEERNGNLTIREKDRDFGPSGIIGVSSEEYTIEIVAPRDVNLEIEGDDGKYEITGFDGFIHLEADDSDAQLSDIDGNDYFFALDDGDLDMEGGNGRLQIRTDDGDVRIRNGNFSDMDVDSDDSEIEITTTLYDDGEYEFDIDDADLTFNITGGGGEFDIRHDDSGIETSREFENIREDEDHSVYRLSGGDARIIIRSDDGDINLEVY